MCVVFVLSNSDVCYFHVFSAGISILFYINVSEWAANESTFRQMIELKYYKCMYINIGLSRAESRHYVCLYKHFFIMVTTIVQFYTKFIGV